MRLGPRTSLSILMLLLMFSVSVPPFLPMGFNKVCVLVSSGVFHSINEIKTVA